VEQLAKELVEAAASPWRARYGAADHRRHTGHHPTTAPRISHIRVRLKVVTGDQLLRKLRRLARTRNLRFEYVALTARVVTAVYASVTT
jgi:hypothetical protein